MEENSKHSSDEIVDLVAGRLAPADAERLLAAAQRDRTLAAEIATLSAMRDELRAADQPSDETLSFGWARLSKTIDEEQKRASAIVSARRWRAVAAVALVACAVQAIVLTVWPFSGKARYETASLDKTAAFSVQVTFAPTAPESELRAVLLQAGATIVEGPSSLGVYLLAFESEDARADGLRILSAADSVVTFASAQ